jgi:lysophospholipase L1-like esterase
MSRFILTAIFSLTFGLTCQSEFPAELKIVGDWRVKISVKEPQPVETTVQIEPPIVIKVVAEKIPALPIFNPNAGGWTKGIQLKGVRAQETTTPFLIEKSSFVLRSGLEADSPVLSPDADYEADLNWGTVGRRATGTIKEGQPVYASYRHAQLRLDAMVLTSDGQVVVRSGEPRSAAPLPAPVRKGERLLANIWLPGLVTKLGPEHLFPILETAYPEPAKQNPTLAERLIPKAFNKLRSGELLRILAWGDSVTVGTYVPHPDRERWQEQFVARLNQRFWKAKIQLLTEAWGGRNTSSYLHEPPGSEHNYAEKVLAAKPDLIVSEFVNDAGMNPQQVEERYAKLLADFQGIGAEWIILTPHYVRPDWMNLNRERDIDNDPRPYVAGLRSFAQKHDIALADASLRYGRLWRQGLPYSTLMLNSINHPDPRGMKIFADALMELFP